MKFFESVATTHPAQILQTAKSSNGMMIFSAMMLVH